MAEVILFDVNETLLDTAALDPWFERHFGDSAAREGWFMQLELLWLVGIATGRYQDFATLVDAALRMRAERAGVAVSSAQRGDLVGSLEKLPAHRDAAAALRRLGDAGLRLAALTNGTLEAARAQLEQAELSDFFEAIFSADEVRRFKPAGEPYAMAIERLHVRPGAAWLVAAHAWDIAGAYAAGLRTAFVARPGKVLNPAGPDPDLVGADLLELSEAILRQAG